MKTFVALLTMVHFGSVLASDPPLSLTGGITSSTSKYATPDGELTGFPRDITAPLFPHFTGAVFGAAATTDLGTSAKNTTTQCLAEADIAVAKGAPMGAANRFCGFFSLSVPVGYGNGVQYEVSPLYARVATQASNDTGLPAADSVGVESQGIILAGTSKGRLVGVDSTISVQAGADGFVEGFETDISNNGAVGQLGTDLNKTGYSAVCTGPHSCTSAFNAAASGAGKWRYGSEIYKQFLITNGCAFCVLDGSAAGTPAIASVYEKGNALLQQDLTIEGSIGSFRSLSFATGKSDTDRSLRWTIGADGTAEDGSNIGSNFQICNYDDTGTIFLGCAFLLNRASKAAIFGGQLTAPNAVYLGPTQLIPTVFANLPKCTGSTQGTLSYITDASAAVTVWHQIISIGGGKEKSFVQCNGMNWLAF